MRWRRGWAPPGNGVGSPIITERGEILGIFTGATAQGKLVAVSVKVATAVVNGAGGHSVPIADFARGAGRAKVAVDH